MSFNFSKKPFLVMLNKIVFKFFYSSLILLELIIKNVIVEIASLTAKPAAFETNISESNSGTTFKKS